MNAYDTARIEALRLPAMDPVIDLSGPYEAFFRRYREREDLLCPEARYADAWAYAIRGAVPSLDEHELIVGKPVHPVSRERAASWEELRHGYAAEISTHEGQADHMAIDYPLLLREGLTGIRRRAEALRDAAPAEKAPFYDGCMLCLDAVCALSEAYADAAEKQAETCEDETRRAELDEIARVCRRVPARPAETFREAVQSASFVTYVLSFDPFRFRNIGQYQLGHPDRYLWPYYEKDLAEGRLNKEQARVLLDCMAIMIDRRVPHGLSCGYMVGGRAADGTPVANDLTELGMQVIDDIRLVYPSVGLCWNRDLPPRLLEKACEILSRGRSHPAIFNDDLITAGLKGYGVRDEDAYEYIHSTCVEITPAAASSIWVASPYTNLPQLLLDCMDREYDSFDDLLAAYFDRLDKHIRRNLEEQLRYRARREKRSLNLFLSCLVNDCLADGVDLERGGARYRWIMPSFVGAANWVDSLVVLKKVVFEEHALTVRGLKAILDTDFEGNEALRLHLLNDLPKYGNDDDEADRYFSLITEHIIAECKKYRTEDERFRLIPSVFCWIMHEQFGRETQATPDGRRAGFPLGDGSGPCQGREHNGPTASILSSTKWCHRELIGGVAVNMKFAKKSFTADSCRKAEALIRTYMARGGFEIQINVVDRETLEEARRDPENHRDLVVRIGGYSDYFVRLSPEMQEEVLLRTAHEV